MNEIVYNILRKCVECPEKVISHKNHLYSGEGICIYLDGILIIHILKSKYTGKLSSHPYSLTGKECSRILRGLEHVAAMKIRRL